MKRRTRPAAREFGGGGEEDVEREDESNQERSASGGEELIGPRDLQEHGAGGGERDEVRPAAMEGDGEQADIEESDVGEKADGVVLSGGNDERREEAAEETEDRDDLRVKANGEEERDGGDERHQGKRGERGEEREAIDDVRRERDGVEADDAGGAENVGGDAIFFASDAQACDDERGGESEADRDADARRDEIVLEGVFDEERDREEGGEAAEPGEEFGADEVFEIERFGFGFRVLGFELGKSGRSWRERTRRR